MAIRLGQRMSGGMVLAAAATCFIPARVGSADAPEVPPTPLQTCASGMLQVQLLGAESGRSSRDLRSPATGRELRWTRLDLRLRSAGTATRLWLPQSVALRNSRGEVWRPAQTSVFFRPNGEGSFAFPDPPARLKGPWRLKLELARSARYLPYAFWDVFSPDELWNIPLLPLPDARETEPLRTHAANAVRDGVHLRLVQVAGAKAGVSVGRVKQPARPSLQVRYSPATPALNVTLLRATDFKGRSIALAGAPVATATTHSRAERSILFPMVPRQDSRILNATFAVHRSRFVELTLPEPRQPRSTLTATEGSRGAPGFAALRSLRP